MMTTQKAISEEKFSVVHGPIEIANQMALLSTGLRSRGHDVLSLNYYPSYLKYVGVTELDMSSIQDLNSRVLLSRQVAEETYGKAQIYHYYFGHTLAMDYSDLLEIGNFGAVGIMHHFGSDVRRLSVSRNFAPDMPVKDPDEFGILRRLEFLGKHIRHTVAHDCEMYELIKDFYEHVHFIPSAIDVDSFQPHPAGTSPKLKIAHAPTSRQMKGTDAILPAVERVADRLDAEIILVEGVSNTEARKLFSESDVVIDQVLAGGYGVAALEAMAMAKPVICWISDWRRDFYPADLPVVSASKDDIEDVLTKLLSDRSRIQEIGFAGRAYVKRYHDISSIVSRVESMYRSALGTQPSPEKKGLGRWSWEQGKPM